MSAFAPYAGAYEYAGALYGWRCYSTARVHELRRREHAPQAAPPGKKWIPLERRHRSDPLLSALMDEVAAEFSQMLAQIEHPWAPSAAMAAAHP